MSYMNSGVRLLCVYLPYTWSLTNHALETGSRLSYKREVVWNDLTTRMKRSGQGFVSQPCPYGSGTVRTNKLVRPFLKWAGGKGNFYLSYGNIFLIPDSIKRTLSLF